MDRIEGFGRPGVASGPPAQTVGVEETGNSGQRLVHLPHTRYRRDMEFSITEQVYGSAAVPGSAQVFTIPEPINYLAFGPSDRLQDVYVSLGALSWRPYGTGAGLIMVPRADYIVRAGEGTREFLLPTRRSIDVSVFVMPPAGYTTPFADGVRIVYGYRPVPQDYLLREFGND